jgi:arginine utilization protein RocB
MEKPMPLWDSITRDLTLRMVRFLSQTDTKGETDFAPFLHDLLSAWPCFQAQPDHLRLERTIDDPLERYILAALVRGNGPHTLILTGHYDVVTIDNYGPLAAWAADPAALLPRLIEALETEAARDPGLAPADRIALDDLRSGHFLPGRGMLDMKSGLAAGLAVLQRFAQLPASFRQGNLLYIAAPDEEIASHGARTAALRLPDLAREWGLDLAAAINLDASDDHSDGALGQAIYMGSIGKLLPAVYWAGRETHAGSPFSGVNSTRLAAELTRRIDCNPDLVDSLDGEFTSPPVCLKQTDTKAHYDVTTPAASWCYYNWLTLRTPVSAVLEQVQTLARQALEAVQRSLHEDAARYAQLTGHAIPLPDWQPRVYLFAEVKALALSRGGLAVQRQLEELEKHLSADPTLDAPTCCLALTEAAWSASGLSGPAAVVGIAALHYAPARVEGAGKPTRLRQVLTRQAKALSREAGTPISLRPFFPGISDVSFLGGRVSAQEMEVLRANSPAWDSRTGFDFGAASTLELPAVNIGPWGRDYHQRIERVYTPYSFEVLPELLWRIARDVLAAA